MNSAAVFDERAEAYDNWYDIPRGRAIFDAELACLRCANPDYGGRWLEVGVGTGRFAEALGIAAGLDPAPNMLARAASRHITIQAGRAESLPYRTGSLDGVLMAFTLCFVDDAQAAIVECARVLKAVKGQLVLGMVPADGPWGRQYRREAEAGHPFYSRARFYTVDEVIALAGGAGLKLEKICSSLFGGPESAPEALADCREGRFADAGFAALAFSA